MATVKNIANEATARDKSYCSYNRTTTDNPNGATTPEYAGEIVYDSTNDAYWQAKGIDNAHWVLMTPTVV